MRVMANYTKRQLRKIEVARAFAASQRPLQVGDVATLYSRAPSDGHGSKLPNRPEPLPAQSVGQR